MAFGARWWLLGISLMFLIFGTFLSRLVALRWFEQLKLGMEPMSTAPQPQPQGGDQAAADEPWWRRVQTR